MAGTTVCPPRRLAVLHDRVAVVHREQDHPVGRDVPITGGGAADEVVAHADADGAFLIEGHRRPAQQLRVEAHGRVHVTGDQLVPAHGAVLVHQVGAVMLTGLPQDHHRAGRVGHHRQPAGVLDVDDRSQGRPPALGHPCRRRVDVVDA